MMLATAQEPAMKVFDRRANLSLVKPSARSEDLNLTSARSAGRSEVDPIGFISRLKRYLSPQIFETILNGENGSLFSSHRREITVVFLDLRGFTAFSEAAEPEEVLDLLRTFHAAMGKLIWHYDGTLERFTGDGLMVFFNDPRPHKDHAERAVGMALQMRDRAKELRDGWLKRGYDLDLGIGVVTGYAALGNIGFEGRMDYGAVGNVINLASRLCGEAAGGQILTDLKTLGRIERMVEVEPLSELRLKGFSRLVRGFNILKLREEQQAAGES